MSQYRTELPQLGNKLFLTDGGLETTLVFLEGMELPYFAAFDLLRDQAGVDILHRYFVRHLNIARRGNWVLFWNPPPGGQTPTGRVDWVMIRPRWPRQTDGPSN